MKKILCLIGLLSFGLALASPAFAQSLSLEMGEGGGSATSRILQFIALLTILSLAPSILVMTTSFTRIIVVLSLLRSALGVQQTPPNSVLISLALFLTLFVMMPTFDQAYKVAIAPLIAEEINETEAINRGIEPFKEFMLRHTRNKDLGLFRELAKIDPSVTADKTPIQAIIPAFMISELRRAFEIGFLIFLPFLIIDMVVASILMSIGMMMVPPAMIALPFKLIFFVLVDGWYLIAGSLVQSFGGG